MQLEQATVGVGSIQDARRDLYRQQILAAAELTFSRAGFADTKMNSIALAADLSLSTVYKTFSGKSEIWDELHAERMKALLAEVDASSREGHSAVERLVDGVSAVARFLSSHDAYLEMSIRAGAGWASSTDLAVGVQKTVWGAGIEMIASGVEAGLARGELRNLRPNVAAGLVVSALQVWLTDWVNAGRDRAPETVVEELAQHLRLVLARPV